MIHAAVRSNLDDVPPAPGALYIRPVLLGVDPIIGAVNPFLANIGLGSWQQQWQSDPDWALRTVMLVMAWQWNGMAVILYLAGLQNVPDDLRHAAMIDGAGRFRAFRDITFPMLAPAQVVLGCISNVLRARIWACKRPALRAGLGDVFGL